MAKSPSRYYLYCQCTGWGGFLILNLLVQLILRSHLEEKWIWRSFLFTLAGLLYTHLLRLIIVKYRWLELPVKQALPKLLLGTILTAAIAGSTLAIAVSSRRFFSEIIFYIIVITPWTTLYYGYDYMRKTRIKDLQRRRQVVDIDFITESLNHIQSMIDQDPKAAREEITAFSQLLRNGYLKQK
jgi:hypothetical protein